LEDNVYPWGIGIGIDIIQVERIRRIIANNEDPFFRKVFTQSEKEGANNVHDKAIYYASRFAAKEAVFKALKLNNINFAEIEVGMDSNNRPTILLLGTLKGLAEKLGIRSIDISLSWEEDYAVAAALVVK
jgi:phosphopantetheine--protein transferase-like protein